MSNALVNDFLGIPPGQKVDMDRLWTFIENCPIRHHGNRRYMPSDTVSIRFARDGNISMSYSQMAHAMGVSSVRVRQLLAKARRDMLHPSNRKALENAYI
jgi:hypothetical protein